MSTSTERVGETRILEGGKARRRVTWRVVLLTVLVLVGLALTAWDVLNGRTEPDTAAGDGASASPADRGPTTDTNVDPTHGTIPPLAGATQLVGGVPVGYPQTEMGAVAAATNYVTLLHGSVLMLTETGRANVFATAVHPDALADLNATLTPGLRQTAEALGIRADGTTDQGTLAMRVLPLGYAITAYTGEVATVEVWYGSLNGVAGQTSAIPVQMGYAVATITVAWADNDWKWLDAETVPGPAPSAILDDPATDPTVMAEALTRFAPYVYGGVQ